jgi:hypothetical protein
MPKRGYQQTEEHKRKISNTHRGSRNGMWKGDIAGKEAGRGRANRLYFTPKNYEIHHIDGNTLNNDPSNILFVERREHMEIDGRLSMMIERNKKGIKPWNAGLTAITDERVAKIAEANRHPGKRGQQALEKHPNWKGDGASQHAKYMREWRRRVEKP